jgi:hypothetical protein
MNLRYIFHKKFFNNFLFTKKNSLNIKFKIIILHKLLIKLINCSIFYSLVLKSYPNKNNN